LEIQQLIDRRQWERKAYCYRQQFPTKGDKAVRAQSNRGRMAAIAVGGEGGTNSV